MATANFQARLERIQNAQVHSAPLKKAPIRALKSAPREVSMQRVSRRRHPIREHLKATLLGAFLGCLAAVLVLGLSMDISPWGPGTEYNALARIPATGVLGLAPVLILVSLMTAAKRPAFALFSLGYLSGLIVPLFV